MHKYPEHGLHWWPASESLSLAIEHAQSQLDEPSPGDATASALAATHAPHYEHATMPLSDFRNANTTMPLHGMQNLITPAALVAGSSCPLFQFAPAMGPYPAVHCCQNCHIAVRNQVPQEPLKGRKRKASLHSMSDMKGRRRGPLNPQARHDAGKARHLRSVCIRCKQDKQKCEGLPCSRCIKKGDRPCVRANFFDVVRSGSCNFTIEPSELAKRIDGLPRTSLPISGLLNQDDLQEIEVKTLEKLQHDLDRQKSLSTEEAEVLLRDVELIARTLRWRFFCW